jgi:hypothetical protein
MADAITVAHRLGLSQSADVRDLVGLLDLTAWTPAGTVPEENPPYLPEPPVPAVLPSAPAAPEDVAGRSTARRSTDAEARTLVEVLPAEPPTPLDWADADPLQPAQATLPPARYQPPLAPYRLRSALAMLLRRPRRGTRPDLEALVTAVATLRPLREILTRSEPSLAHGTTVVADVGAGMVPLIDDVDHLVDVVRQVVGEPTVTVHWSDDGQDLSVADLVGAPAGSGTGATNGATVDSARPVLVLSGLGAVRAPLARPGSALRWSTFLTALQAHGFDVVALVPHRRTAHRLAATVRAVAWDDLPVAGRGRR